MTETLRPAPSFSEDAEGIRLRFPVEREKEHLS